MNDMYLIDRLLVAFDLRFLSSLFHKLSLLFKCLFRLVDLAVTLFRKHNFGANSSIIGSNMYSNIF